MGTSAELSQITIWDNGDGLGDPVFSTPDTLPAYVPVEQLTLTFSPGKTPEAGSNPPQYRYTSVPGTITLTPAVSPTWSDNLYVEWFTELCEIDGVPVEDESDYPMKLSGNGTAFTVAGIYEADGVTPKQTWPGGRITSDNTKMPLESVTRMIFKGVSRDLELDVEPLPANYALQQTLAEYRFEVVVDRRSE